MVYEVKVEVLCLPGTRKARRGDKVSDDQCGTSLQRFLDNGSIVKVNAPKAEPEKEPERAADPSKPDPRYFGKKK